MLLTVFVCVVRKVFFQSFFCAATWPSGCWTFGCVLTISQQFVLYNSIEYPCGEQHAQWVFNTWSKCSLLYFGGIRTAVYSIDLLMPWSFPNKKFQTSMDVQRWTRKKYKKLSFFNISISCPTYRSQPKKRMTTCPNIQSKQQIGFACTLHDPGPSVLLTLDLTLGTLQQFSSFLSACETPQTGVRHWSNTSTDKRLIFPRAMRRILPRKQILCRHVPRKAIWHTHTRREWIIIWSGRNWVLKHAD